MRASISYAIQDHKDYDSKFCQSSIIAKKYFNVEYVCKNRAKRKFCRKCHRDFVYWIENNGDFAYFYKFYKCKICFRIGVPFCKLHTCNQCTRAIDFYTVILCLKQFKLPKDVIRYVLYPMCSTIQMFNHSVNVSTFRTTMNYVKDCFPFDIPPSDPRWDSWWKYYFQHISCPYDIEKCRKCDNYICNKILDSDRFVTYALYVCKKCWYNY